MLTSSAPALLYQNFFFFFFFLRLGEGRPLPPLRTTTLIQTRAPQQLHTQELGFLPYATSYHLQRLCKTEKKTVKSGAGHKGERCAESRRDPGRWKEEGGSDHLAHRAPHLDTLRSEKSHRFLKVPVTIIFFVLEVVVFYIVLFFRQFLSGTLQIHFWPFWKFQAPLVFGWPTKSILFDFSTQKSLNKNILGKKCYSHNRAPSGSSQPSLATLCWTILLIFNVQAVSYPAHFQSAFPLPSSRVGVDIWAVRILCSCWLLCVSVRVCVCALIDRRSGRHKIGSGKSQTKTAPGVWISSQNTVFQSWLCASYRGSNLGRGLQGFLV